MKRARKVSNVHVQVHFKQKQRLTIAFTGNTLPYRNQSRKDAEDFMPSICNATKTELPYDAPKRP